MDRLNPGDKNFKDIDEEVVRGKKGDLVCARAGFRADQFSCLSSIGSRGKAGDHENRVFLCAKDLKYQVMDICLSNPAILKTLFTLGCTLMIEKFPGPAFLNAPRHIARNKEAT